MELFYEPELFLSLLELVCGLIIIGTILQRVSYFRELNWGKILILISGFIIVVKEIFFMAGYLPVSMKMINTIVFICFALGISFFYSRNQIFK